MHRRRSKYLVKGAPSIICNPVRWWPPDGDLPGGSKCVDFHAEKCKDPEKRHIQMQREGAGPIPDAAGSRIDAINSGEAPASEERPGKHSKIFPVEPFSPSTIELHVNPFFVIANAGPKLEEHLALLPSDWQSNPLSSAFGFSRRPLRRLSNGPRVFCTERAVTVGRVPEMDKTDSQDPDETGAHFVIEGCPQFKLAVNPDPLLNYWYFGDDE
ncbi:hypothetical protein C8R44DRAFT_749273 [Mycena epipterygia]|nr:hypothetical protein C8R44DRAFT_749273 [Mycena epipterygia]